MVKHMAWAIHGQTLDNRSRQVCATKPQAVFKTVSATLKLFPLTNLWCGLNRAGCSAAFLCLSVCQSSWLPVWLVAAAWLVHLYTGWLALGQPHLAGHLA